MRTPCGEFCDSTHQSCSWLLGLVSVPRVGAAQVLGTVAGTVKDASGAVLPGVTVEASSPALIEKVRTAVTDGAGQYRIVNLPPGTYVVTFTLTGFSTVRREGVDVSINVTSNIDAELRVGDLKETDYGDAARRRSSIFSRPHRPPWPTRGHSRSSRQADRG